MKYRRTEIVLAQFPFTDETGNKLRPVLILTESSQIHSDYLVMFISSQLSQKEEYDFIIDPTHVKYAVSGLTKQSVIKLLKLGTISESLILGTLGNLHLPTFDEILKTLVKKLQSE